MRRTDEVDVYVETARSARIDSTIKRLRAGELPHQDPATLVYPADEWGVPAPSTVYDKIQELISPANTGHAVSAVIGIAASPDRRPLAAARAALLVLPDANEYTPVSFEPTYVVVPEKVTREAIVVVLSQKQIPQ